MLELTDLVVLFVLGLCVLLWWNTQTVKMLARQTANRHCHQLGLQMLDDSVAIFGFRFALDKSTGLSVHRKFQFEFTSTGDERYKGIIGYSGTRLQGVELEPHILPEEDFGP